MKQDDLQTSIFTIVCGIALLTVSAYPNHDWGGVAGTALILLGCVWGIVTEFKK